MANSTNYNQLVAELLTLGLDKEQIIQSLKEQGANQIETVKTLVGGLKISLPEANNLVLNSVAWQSSKEGTTKLRNLFFDAMENPETT